MTRGERSGGAYSIGWLTSISLHATLAIGALILTQRITLAPNPAPFTWNVALVSAPSEPTPASVSPAQAVPTPFMKKPSPASLPPARAAANDGGITARAMTVEPPSLAPEKPMVHTNEASPVLGSHESRESTEERQTVDQVTSQGEPTAAASQFSSREPQAPSNLVTTAPSEQQEPARVGETVSPTPSPSPRADYSWLSETILRRMQELKRYPAEARFDRAEGKVVLKAVIQSNGSIEAVEVKPLAIKAWTGPRLNY